MALRPVARTAGEPAAPRPATFGHAGWALLLVLAATIAIRLVALTSAGPDALSPDGARFLNLARSIERGLGYVTPEAWPAWLEPARLPTPETFKEPGYPYAIAAMRPVAGEPFRAGRWVSLLAGFATPLLAWALVLALARDRTAALLAGLLAAASPVLIRQSVYVMAESLFAMLLTASFALSAWRPATPRSGRVAAAAAGLALGLAYLVRAQALLAVPAVVGLAFAGRTRPRALGAAGLALALAALAALPWWVRNLRLFGDAFHSDVTAFAIWPYVDTFAFSHRSAHPPAPLPFVLAHPAQVLAQFGGSLRRFGWHTLPHDLLGSRIWLVPFLIGAGIALGRWRRWWPVLLFAGLTAAFLFPLNWVERYFAAVAPIACALAGLGTAWLLGGVREGAGVASPWPARAVFAGIAALLLVGGVDAARTSGDLFRPELAEARAAGPRLGERVPPGEAVMAEITSYWAWYADRPAVEPVLGDEAELRAVVRRYRIRAAAFTDDFEREYASRLPGGTLPGWFVAWPEQPVSGVRLYDLRPESRSP